ncbi:MAG TPA: DNA-processing protein DprA [Symbiobacteriaceae bacterium]|nr:DNA-processing protein DprA [Symbiobacteriaceae bacterium]
MGESIRWLVMAQAEGVGRRRLATLMAAVPDPVAAWRLTASELAALEGWSRPVASNLVAARQSPVAWARAEADWRAAERAGLQLIALASPHYPRRLRLIPDPPPLLYQAGPGVPDDRPAIAIVGTRKPTPYGLSVAERFGADLAAAGAVVISGLALGIDSAAHRGALRVGGLSVAVLGTGADVPYPRASTALYRRLVETGAVLSELPPGTGARAEAFPERNRIISGLADAIVVVEAGERSGTLITVQSALEQGREVFAVPGPVWSPMSVGPHRLLGEGAALGLSATQILAELGLEATMNRHAPPNLGPEEAQLLAWMGDGPWTAGALVQATGLSPAEVQARLTLLAVRGLVQILPGGQFLRVGETGAIGV